MFQTKFVDKNQKTVFMFNNPPLRPDNVEKYGRPRHATDDNTAQAHCMLDT
jgi:hypothetical protein